jgi:hypothetical protein
MLVSRKKDKHVQRISFLSFCLSLITAASVQIDFDWNHAMKTCGSGGMAPSFLISGLDGGEWSLHVSAALHLRKKPPGTHCIGDWEGTRAGIDAVE